MTPRQRFNATMRYTPPDRVPWLEEGLRDDVLNNWHEQGLPADSDLAALFHYDRRERIELDMVAWPKLNRPPRAWENLSALRKGLDPNAPGRLPADWGKCVERWRHRDHILELPLHSGLFLTLGVHEWASAEPALYLLADQPLLAREVMDAQAKFVAALADRVLSEVEVDFASFSEPIGGNNGPLVSPRTYKEIVLESYKPILEVLRKHHVETIVFMTYANAALLLPLVLDAGFNCLWAMETESGAMDYRALRRRFGKSLRLIGGIDLDALLAGEAATEHEIKTKVPALLAEGGFIPLADGRVRASVPYRAYAHYRRLLEEITQR
ncbi:MAG: uroporphyrinogen decarboxylase family protein [Planctomycetota bacterium]